MDYRDDPEWQEAHDRWVGEHRDLTADQAALVRADAAAWMYQIEKRYEESAA